MEESNQSHVSIVRYGEENKNIPGDPGGWKMKDCGNICHWSSKHHYMVGLTKLYRQQSKLANPLEEFPGYGNGQRL
jgi:hypothetical protein